MNYALDRAKKRLQIASYKYNHAAQRAKELGMQSGSIPLATLEDARLAADVLYLEMQLAELDVKELQEPQSCCNPRATANFYSDGAGNYKLLP